MTVDSLEPVPIMPLAATDPAHAATVRDLIRDQPDADQLAAILGIDVTE